MRATPTSAVLGEAIFTDYLFAFEITSVLLVIAVVGAVVLARTPRATSAELRADAEAAAAAAPAAQAPAEQVPADVADTAPEEIADDADDADAEVSS